MKLSSQKIRLVILLTTVALVGLVILQTVLLRTALQAEEEAFQRSVLLALNRTTQALSSSEARQAILQITISDSSGVENCRVVGEDGVMRDREADTLVYFWQGGGRPDSLPDSSHRQIRYQFVQRESERSIAVEDTVGPGMVAAARIPGMHDSGNAESVVGVGFDYTFTVDSAVGGEMEVSQFFRNDSSRVMLIQTALTQLEQFQTIPLALRLDTVLLDSVLNTALTESGIDLQYCYGVTEDPGDTLYVWGGADYRDQLLSSSLRTRLFPFDIVPGPSHLVVYFANKQAYIYAKMGKIVLPTLLFLIIIVGCFVYSIRTIVQQRKTAHRLTDFINNMTHEFKTPISTVQLVAEAISRDDVLENQEKVKQFNSMILAENRRMKNHVDKILQIATLEEGDYIIKSEPVDMHALVNEAVESVSIHVNDRDGVIESTLEADNAGVMGDAVHLLNVLHNLLDNAVKYSDGPPRIRVSSENVGDHLLLRVRDNGIGIHADDAKHVFNKYYRVSQGDVHDVKGFGLGLSYVKMMMDAHRGSVALVSSLGKGTEVSLKFPTI